MPFAKHVLSAEITANPKAAKEKILGALRTAGMHMETAAAELGCAHNTLLRWIDKLGIGNDVEKLRVKARKEGWHHDKKGGRPVGTRNPPRAATR